MAHVLSLQGLEVCTTLATKGEGWGVDGLFLSPDVPSSGAPSSSSDSSLDLELVSFTWNWGDGVQVAGAPLYGSVQGVLFMGQHSSLCSTGVGPSAC